MVNALARLPGPDRPVILTDDIGKQGGHYVCMTGRSRRSTVLACVLFTAAACADAAAIVGVVVTHMRFAAVRDSFLVPNAPIGFACAACGLLIAWHRPANRLGWLLLAAGACQSVTAGVTPWLARAMVDGSPPVLVRLLGTIYGFAWPWAISLFIPLALLLFPDGRLLPGSRWRVVAAVAIVNAPAQVLEFSSTPGWSGLQDQLGEAAEARGRSWIALPDFIPAALGNGSNAVLGLVFVAAIVGLIMRYVRGGERARRQLLWLMLATAVTTIVFVASRVSTDHQPGVPVLVLTVFVLIPVSIAVAVLRYQLLDIRLVFSRTVSYLLLVGGVVLTYVALGALLELMLQRQAGLGTSVLVTVLIAVGFNPARVGLQRLVDRAVYGGKMAGSIRFDNSIYPILGGFGLPPDLIQQAERYNFRYRIRIIGILLTFGVALNSAIAGGLLRLGYGRLGNGPVWVIVGYALVSSALSVLLTAPLLQAVIRMNRSTYTIYLLLQAIVALARLKDSGQADGRIRHRRRVYRNLRAARQGLRSNAWMLAGNLAVLSGRHMNERDWPPVAVLGRWLCWVAEDLNDAGRVDGAMQACVDTIRHILGPTPFALLSLCHPPRQARMMRPPRSERLSRYSTGTRTVLISLVPIIAASIGLATKLVP